MNGKLMTISRNKGFTLIELLVAVGIIAITLGVGLPSFQAAIASNRLTSAANDLVVALQSARSASIKQLKFAGVSIDTAANNWYAFLDSSTLVAGGGTGELIQTYEATKGVTVAVTSAGLNDETPTYRSDGRLASSTVVTIEFTAVGNAEKRRVYIQPSGRVGVCVIPDAVNTCPY